MHEMTRLPSGLNGGRGVDVVFRVSLSGRGDRVFQIQLARATCELCTRMPSQTASHERGSQLAIFYQ